MNRAQIATAVVAVALAAGGAGLLALDGEPAVTETEPTQIKAIAKKGDIASESVNESKVGWLEDGGKVYRVPVRLKDGGRDLDEKAEVEAPCKRRPKGVDGSLCLHVQLDLKGVVLQAPAPELNRYPAAEMIGVACQPCACSVWAGEDPDAEETPPKEQAK